MGDGKSNSSRRKHGSKNGERKGHQKLSRKLQDSDEGEMKSSRKTRRDDEDDDRKPVANPDYRSSSKSSKRVDEESDVWKPWAKSEAFVNTAERVSFAQDPVIQAVEDELEAAYHAGQPSDAPLSKFDSEDTATPRDQVADDQSLNNRSHQGDEESGFESVQNDPGNAVPTQPSVTGKTHVPIAEPVPILFSHLTMTATALVPVSIQASRPLYKRPVQRQRWGEAESSAPVPWHDVFFDLFYVAGAYNLANIIVINPTFEGLLYFTGCFWAVYTMWLEEMYYEARYKTAGDYWHLLYHVSFYLVVATAILHVRSVAVMSVPTQHVDMFSFSLACVLANCFHMGRYVEVILFGEGEPASVVSSRHDICSKIVPTGLYLGATVVSGVAYYQGNEGDETVNHVPIILLCCAALFEILWGFVYLFFLFPHGEKRRKVSIPININYCIHRYGEYSMLILGESILSLLIVEVVSKGLEYYVTFYTGVISVCLLMYLNFFSGPTHVEEHAMHRHVQTSYIISILMQFYFAGLVIVGASFKLFMYEYTYENYEEEYGRRLRILIEYVRSLAGKGHGDFDESTRRQQISYFFCFSLGIVWLCADLLMVLHKGLRYNWKRLRNETSDRVRITGVILFFVRIGLLAFIGTLWLYETDPHLLASIGMCCNIVQVILRAIGNVAFPHESDEHGDAEDGSEENDGQDRNDEDSHSRMEQSEVANPDQSNADVRSGDEEAVEITNE